MKKIIILTMAALLTATVGYEMFKKVTGINHPPNTPSNPSQTDAATGQSVTVDLSWTGGDPDTGDTVTYDVYFGTNSAPDQLVSNDQTGTTYDPGTLSDDTHYYWKIIATDNHGASTESPVWNFTTSHYTDNGDGTITDNRTGLMWVKDGNSAGCNNGGILSWYEAASFCENLDYAGYTDWRLPSIDELKSIVDKTTSSPTINTTCFPNTKSGGYYWYYWSSTTGLSDGAFACYVDFYDGNVDDSYTANSLYVRPVRGGQ